MKKIANISFKGKKRAALVEEERLMVMDRSVKEFIENGGIIEKEISLKKGELLPAIDNPSKIICVGLNYKDHAQELIDKNMLDDLPTHPVIFLKPPSSLVAHKGDILWPEDEDVKRVDYEAEFALIIGKRIKNADYEKAVDGVCGFSCFNDVTARNVQKEEKQWTRAKSYDSFAPLGPWMVYFEEREREQKIEFAKDLKIKAILNGKNVQDSRTGNMLFSPFQIVSFISKIMTLEIGDVIATGTPAGVGELKRGDRIEIETEKIGKLTNYVK